MFRSMFVQLQAQAGPRVDHDVLHLEALAAVDRVEPPPGAMYPAMVKREALVVVVDAGHQLLEVVGLVLVCHQHGIGGLYDHQILPAEDRDQPRIERAPGYPGCLQE